MPRYGGASGAVPAVNFPLNQLGSNQFFLPDGGAMIIPPGRWNCYTDGISYPQWFDPAMLVWRPLGPGNDGTGGIGSDFIQLDSDGSNYRFANTTSCPVGAILTNKGSGYTSVPTVTASEGGSTWLAFVGGAISTTITITAGGSGYTYPPQLIIQQPTGQGIPATATCALTAGVVSSITVQDQGANYTQAPAVTFLNDPRDTTGSGAAATTVLTGAQTVTGVLNTEYFGGTLVTSGTVPTLTFSGGGGSAAAATAVMDWLVTGYAVTGAGGGFVAPVEVSTIGTGIPTTAPAYVTTQRAWFRTRPMSSLAALTGGGITATGAALQQSGRVGGVTSNIGILVNSNAAPTTTATLTLAVGGAASFVYIQNAGAG